MLDGPNRPRYLSAAEAAALLGVSRATLYAYVSRGRLRSEPDPGDPRASRYLARDVQRLLDRKQARRRPELTARSALDWGAPILESGLTLIDAGGLHYRGRDALALARNASFEDVVRLLWESEESDAPSGPLSASCREALDRVRPLPAMERMQAVLPVAAAEDPGAFDVRPARVRTAGGRILTLLAAAAAPGSRNDERPVAERLASGWRTRAGEARRALDMALILCADHELNVSAFAVRVVASAGSSPYDVVAAGLAALRGPRHGGHTARVEGLLDEAGSADALRWTLEDRIRRGEAVPGFGHPLYPEGDPRARALFGMVEEVAPRSTAAALARASLRAGRDLLGHEPNLDFGLVTLRRALHLPRGSALVLFALGRTAGWIAHAMEQYALDRLIRPRAAYVGPTPGPV